jgi:hypothetical protein
VCVRPQYLLEKDALASLHESAREIALESLSNEFYMRLIFDLDAVYYCKMNGKGKFSPVVEICAYGQLDEIKGAKTTRSSWKWFSDSQTFYEYLTKAAGQCAAVFVSADEGATEEAAERLSHLRFTPSVLVGPPGTLNRVVRALDQPNIYFVPIGIAADVVSTMVSFVRARMKFRESQEATLKPASLLSAVGDTGFLCDSQTGRLDARSVASLFGLSLRELAGLIGLKYETVHKTPSSPQAHHALLDYERVARLLGLLGNDQEAFRQWLNRKNRDLDQRTPLEAIREGYVASVADLVESALLGEPR